MIVDCFPFFEEFDVLELRMRTLEDVVDRWVIVESPFTFRGAPKSMHLHERPDLLARWRDRVTLLAYREPPGDHSWENERRQRDYVKFGLAGCALDDLILLSDCDEIPDPALAGTRPHAHLLLAHRMVNAEGYLNRLSLAGERCRLGTRAFVYRDLAAVGELGNLRHLPFDDFDYVDSGWHFTSLGGSRVLDRKIAAYSHAENDLPYYRDLMRLDVVFASDVQTWWPIDERFPEPVRADPARWQRFVWPEHAALSAGRARELAHVHGMFGYLPADAASLAVLAADPAAWNEAGQSRFGTAFRGAFGRLEELLDTIGAGAWVVIDGLERQPRRTLAALHDARASAVAFARNARSYEVFRSVLGEMRAYPGESNGLPRYPPGRALGRAEYLAESIAAGLQITRVDRILTSKLYVEPPKHPVNENVALEMFAFPEISTDALYDFLSDAFIVVVQPR
jgi:beta-1,4-mannosyl-glycoprotein beta-1,4-N-acetylglucosaminyltransferase